MDNLMLCDNFAEFRIVPKDKENSRFLLKSGIFVYQ